MIFFNPQRVCYIFLIVPLLDHIIRCHVNLYIVVLLFFKNSCVDILLKKEYSIKRDKK